MVLRMYYCTVQTEFVRLSSQSVVFCQVKYFIGCLKIDANREHAVVQCAQSTDTLRKAIYFYPGT